MRRVMTLLGVMAIVVLAAGAAQAWYLPFDSEGVPGSGFDAAFYASTTMNSPWTNSDPSSTYDGAIWINSGSGPVMLTTAVNADLWVNDYDASWGSGGNGTGGANGWVEEVRLLNSDGSASGDFAADLPGTFNNTIPEQGVPGTYWQAYDNRGSKSKGYGSDTVFQFQLYLWTGTETTYAAGLAAGEYTADASWSQTVMAAQSGAIPPMPPGDIDNPAMILENLPGDANGDGRVDINDLTIVLAHSVCRARPGVPGRLHRRRQSGHQRPDHRAGATTATPSDRPPPAWPPCPSRRFWCWRSPVWLAGLRLLVS